MTSTLVYCSASIELRSPGKYANISSNISPYTAINDFIPTTSELSFDALTASQPVCQNISIINDEIIEGVEDFVVVLTAVSAAADVVNGVATVSILDNDGNERVYTFLILYN